MKKNSILVKTVLMSMLTAGSVFSFTSCADDLEIDKAPVNPETEQTAKTRTINDMYYNINKEGATPFTRDNWHSHNGIYMRVANNSFIDESVKDAQNRIGYYEEILPWATDCSPLSHIPESICDETTPENGWALVANFCGDFYHANANYMVFYNKYQGKLRYFYFMPRDVETNNAADHNFEVLMQNGTAEHTVFGYAIPMKRKIKTPEKIKAHNGNYWVQYVTPYTDTQSKLGQLAPMKGWYAFDIDLSVYRGLDTSGETSMKHDKFIKPILRGYNKSNVEMIGKMMGDITGNIDLKKCCVNSTGGVFGPLESMVGSAKDMLGFVTNAKEVYGNLMKGDILGAVEGGISVAKQGCNLVGIDYGDEKTGFGGFQGEVSMKLNGTLDFSGKITEDAIIKGTDPINQSMTQFDFDGTCLGQGVWNIEDAPVVYYTNAYNEWLYKQEEKVTYAFNDDYNYEEFCNYPLRKSPFGGQIEGNNIWGESFETRFSKAPYGGVVCYFDPSSIKLALNPKLFTQKEIESAKVYATCGVRKDAKFGSTETFRDIQSLQESRVEVKDRLTYYCRPFHDAPFDALSSHKDKTNMKTGTKFDVDIVGGKQYGVFGRGDSDYILEAQPLYGQGGTDLMPAYEVTVTVIVIREDTGKPMVYSRNYLPEYKEMKVQEMPEINSQNLMEGQPNNYASEVYKQQRAHIRDIYNWTRRTLHPTSGTPSCYSVDNKYRNNGSCNNRSNSPKECYANLFDNDLSNRWVSSYGNVEIVRCDEVYASGKSVDNGVWRDNPCWYVEFKSHFPISPKSYQLFAANDASKYPQCNPNVWYLYGKKNPKDPWIKLTSHSYNNQPQDMLPRKSNEPTRELKFRLHECKDMQYFRFECQDADKTDPLLRLGEIRFNYDD